MKSIVLTGGGTAGHVMPALALVPYLRPTFGAIYYTGQLGGVEERLSKQYGLPFFGTQTIRFERTKWWKNAAIPFVLHRATNEICDYLSDVMPDVVFSKGGYCALPTVLAAHRLGIPVVCHESDYTLGLANRLTAHYTRHVLTSFVDTKGGSYMGNPIRDEILQGVSSHVPPFATRRPVLLAMGGSLGAMALNRALVDAMPYLGDFNVINIYGRSPVACRSPSFRALPFVDNIQDYLALADVVLCRAGANTLFELAALGLPTVTVPLPKGDSRGDQVQNARYFANHFGFTCLDQASLTPKGLAKAIADIYRHHTTHSPYRPCNAQLAAYLTGVAKHNESCKNRSKKC